MDPSPLEGPLFLGLAAPVARQHHPAPPPLVVMAVSTCRLPPQSALSPAVVLAIHAGIDLVRSICFVTSLPVLQGGVLGTYHYAVPAKRWGGSSIGLPDVQVLSEVLLPLVLCNDSRLNGLAVDVKVVSFVCPCTVVRVCVSEGGGEGGHKLMHEFTIRNWILTSCQLHMVTSGLPNS